MDKPRSIKGKLQLNLLLMLTGILVVMNVSLILLINSRTALPAAETALIKKYLIYISLVLFLFVVAIALWLIQKATKPVDALKKGLEMMSHGNLAYRIDIQSSDEFSFLGGKFNQMAQQLESMMIELEAATTDLSRQVQERTQDLDTANKQLQKANDELKATQKRVIMAETQKSLTTIVSGFAHEINNPLTGILGYIDLLEMKNTLEPAVQTKLKLIKNQALRIKNIIDELNRLNPEIDQTKLMINLSNMLEKLVKITERKHTGEGILFETHLPGREILVHGNHFALYQVFEGLLENAVEAITESGAGNGKIDVSLSLTDDLTLAIVQVTDNGGGFNDIEKAFEPFYTTKSRTQKKGIGLSIAYNVVQEHKGNILIANHKNGAALTVTLPLKIKRLKKANEKPIENQLKTN